MAVKDLIKNGCSTVAASVSKATSFLGGISGAWPWILGCVLVVLVLCGLSGWKGYQHGFNVAKDAGDAKYSKLEASVAAANRLASDTARKIVDAEVVRRNELEKKLAVTLDSLGVEHAANRRKIQNAASSVRAADDGSCTFGPEWVHSWNQALGLSDGDSSLPGTSGQYDNATAGANSSQSRVLSERVTPADVLANHIDNAAQCRELTERYKALVKWSEGLPKTRTVQEGE